MNNLTAFARTAFFVAAAAFWGAPAAHADSFAIGVGPKGGINFSYSSGGYCDELGCPDTFWDMPVYYCPVFHHGRWYRGPVYYRHGPRGTQFWIGGAWRYDAWRGPRPSWACDDRFGPSLGFEYYEHHGFHMRPAWRESWRRGHPAAPHARPGSAGPDRPGMRPGADRHAGPDRPGKGLMADPGKGPKAGPGDKAGPGKDMKSAGRKDGPGAAPKSEGKKGGDHGGPGDKDHKADGHRDR